MNQPSLDYIGQRDDAMARVSSKAEDVRPNFRDDATGYILYHLEKHGPTTGEALTLACKAAGIVPHDDRAFGPVYMQLSKRGLIEKVGTVKRTRGHGTSGGNVWRRK